MPVGTRLGEFELVGLVGEGGFGIVYLAHDHSLERKVALKEYMPSSLASRANDSSVAVRSERHRETFEVGRRSFVNEARLLAQFDHPALVKVYRFWEANGTAYMAMPFYDGITLRDALKERGSPPDEAWIRKILSPVMDALEIIHNQSCFHRDIAPDNIMLLRDDRPVLLDFGAARRVIGDMTQALTVILKPGYAPIEQYAEMPGMKQGPWTDIYALGAVVYFMITGKTPPPSVGRMMQDSYEPLATIAAGRYDDSFLQGIDRCLAVKAEDRPQSIAAMRELVGFGSNATVFAPVANVSPAARAKPAERAVASAPDATVVRPAAAPAQRPAPPVAQGATPKRSNTILIGAALGGLVVIGIGGYLVFGRQAPVAPPVASVSAPQVAPPAAQSPVATVSAPLAQPVEPPKPVSLAQAEEALLTNAGVDFGVVVEKVKSPVVIGKDALSFSLSSAKSGYLYLLLHDKGAGTLSLIFPNALDPENQIAAGKAVRFPRPNWTFDADQPRGDWEVMALVSESPRQFDKLGFSPREGIASATVAEVEAALSRAGIKAMAGSVQCADGTANCGAAYGLATFSVNETDAPVVSPPAKKPAEAPAPRAEKTPPAEKKPGGKGKGAGSDGNPSEEEYMKKLNRDLDQLLGGKK
nr:serine/threonine-protein kinase [Niveibacterium umoris]